MNRFWDITANSTPHHKIKETILQVDVLTQPSHYNIGQLRESISARRRWDNSFLICGNQVSLGAPACAIYSALFRFPAPHPLDRDNTRDRAAVLHRTEISQEIHDRIEVIGRIRHTLNEPACCEYDPLLPTYKTGLSNTQFFELTQECDDRIFHNNFYSNMLVNLNLYITSY